MPEGPDIRKIAAGLQMFVGARVLAVEAAEDGMYSTAAVASGSAMSRERARNFRESAAELRRELDGAPGITVEAVRVHGKLLWFELSGGWVLRVKPNTDGAVALGEPPEHAHVRIAVEHAAAGLRETIWYADSSRRGRVCIDESRDDLDRELAGHGADPLEPGEWEEKRDIVAAQLAGTRKSLPSALLNQMIFAGVGNYLRAEIVCATGLPRARWELPTKDLTDAERARVIDAVAEQAEKFMAPVRPPMEAYRHKNAKFVEIPKGRRFYFRA